MPRNRFRRDVCGGYVRSICIHCSCFFLVIWRLFPPSSGGVCGASPVGLEESAVATKSSKTDQGEFDKTATACQSASKTDQGEFTEAHSGRQKPGQIGASAAAKEA